MQLNEKVKRKKVFIKESIDGVYFFKKGKKVY